MSRRRPPIASFRLVAGLAVVAVGLLLVFDQLGYETARYLEYWPVGLIALGLVRALGRRPQDWILALLLVGVGSWILLYNLDYLQEEPWQYFWPLILLFLGGNLVYGALRPKHAGAAADSHASVYAVLSGTDRKIASEDFRGADVTAIMGGGTIDLRRAKIPSGHAEVRALAFWGGVEVRVPPDWRIEFGVLPILGGYDDETRQEPGPDSPTLKISGSVIMGGLDIKN